MDNEDNDLTGVSPLFIHGGVGLGKTHLLQGICRRMLARQPHARIHYTTGEQFTNEFLTAVRSGKIDAFRQRIRKLDLLAVDDVHFIANKTATQQEFLHCFNAIDLAGARIVLASDQHPKLIQQFSQALVNRCVRGMVATVTTPDTSTRVKIVQTLAHRRGINLLESVVAVVAAKCPGSVRELEGTLTRLHALATLSPTTRGEDDNTAGLVGHTLVNRAFAAELMDERAGRCGWKQSSHAVA
ncbi:MAG: ATP-binding protein, partial [Phycisphaerales bacterium]|nr:ATP-binding protein [Phycisphaerales bacterium]